jgi:hypothetical protein
LHYGLPVTVKVEPADPDGLRRCFETANGACDGISEQAWHPKTFRQLALGKGVYYQVRERFGWSAQMAVQAIAKAVDAYALDKRTKRMGHKPSPLGEGDLRQQLSSLNTHHTRGRRGTPRSHLLLSRARQ